MDSVETLNDLHAMSCMRLAVFVALRTRYSRDRTCSVRVRIAFIASRVLYMMLGQRDLRAKASMQCLFGLVNEPYFSLFSSIGFNFKVLILGAWGLRPTYNCEQDGQFANWHLVLVVFLAADKAH